MCFTALFVQWSLSSKESSNLLSPKSRNVYSILLIVDYCLWSSSRFWSKYLTSLPLGYVLSSSHFFWAKMLVLLAYGTLMMVPSEPKARSSDVNIVKSKVRANFENRIPVTEAAERRPLMGKEVEPGTAAPKELLLRAMEEFVQSGQAAATPDGLRALAEAAAAYAELP